MNILLKITGFALLILALIHLIFPRYFKWKTELGQLSLINRQLMEVHTFFIAVMVALMGLLCLFTTTTDWKNPMGMLVAIGISIFWYLRLLVQLFYYSSSLWRGKRWETSIHLLFTCLWIFLGSFFAKLAFQATTSA